MSNDNIKKTKTATTETNWELLYRFYQCFPPLYTANYKLSIYTYIYIYIYIYIKVKNEKEKKL